MNGLITHGWGPPGELEGHRRHLRDPMQTCPSRFDMLISRSLMCMLILRSPPLLCLHRCGHRLPATSGWCRAVLLNAPLSRKVHTSTTPAPGRCFGRECGPPCSHLVGPDRCRLGCVPAHFSRPRWLRVWSCRSCSDYPVGF